MRKDPDVGCPLHNGPLLDMYYPCPHGNNPSKCLACKDQRHQANELLLEGIMMALNEQTGEEQEETLRTMMGMGPKDKNATIMQLEEKDKVWDDLRALIEDDEKFDAVQKLIKFHWEER